MRRELVALALVLATGGWVCDSSDPCSPAELTCTSDVADHMCCPQGTPYRCDGHCSATPDCSDYLVCKYPDDPGSGLCTAGAYQATIGGVTCTPPTPMDPTYHITVSGTLVGCGTTPVQIEQRLAGGASLTTDCGTWAFSESDPRGDTFQCTPGGELPQATTWQIRSTPYQAGVHLIDVSITLQIADKPVLASATLMCPP